MAEMNEKRDDSNRLIDGLICSDRSKGFLSIIRVDLFLSIDDTRYLSILDPSERNRYVSYFFYIVCRAPKRLASSVLLSIGPMHWLISWREKANVVSCLVVVRRPTHSPASSHTETKMNAVSLLALQHILTRGTLKSLFQTIIFRSLYRSD